MRKPKCPYCGDELNYAKTWTLKRRGEYICPKCGGLSNVRLDPLLYRIGILALVAEVCFFAAGWFFRSFGSVFWTVPGILLPSALFFLVSVFFVRLKKPALRRPHPAPRSPGAYAPPGRTAPPR